MIKAVVFGSKRPGDERCSSNPRKSHKQTCSWGSLFSFLIYILLIVAVVQRSLWSERPSVEIAPWESESSLPKLPFPQGQTRGPVPEHVCPIHANGNNLSSSSVSGSPTRSVLKQRPIFPVSREKGHKATSYLAFCFIIMLPVVLVFQLSLRSSSSRLRVTDLQ